MLGTFLFNYRNVRNFFDQLVLCQAIRLLNLIEVLCQAIRLLNLIEKPDIMN